MAGKLTTDVNTSKIQALAPVRNEKILANGTFTPTSNNRAFCVGSETGVQYNGTGEYFPMMPGMSFGIIKNFTYTFDTEVIIAIM